MVEIWYVILAGMLTTYFVLDGGNIGAGLLHFAVGKTAPDRRQLITAIGPLWLWHEVWLVAFGGILFVAFPNVLATALAGFYLAIFLLLWSLILRGLALELAGHIADPLWRTAWDVVFAVANILLAVLIGAAFGNLLRGVPLEATGKFTLAFFTHFGVRGHVGILDWYTISVAVFTVVLLAAHGAAFLMLKTAGPLHDRSAQWGQRLWFVVFGLLLLISGETHWVRQEILRGMLRNPFAWLGIALVLAGAVSVMVGLRRRSDRLVWCGSCTFLIGLMVGGAASVFPVMLHSTLDPAYSLTAHNGAAAGHGLNVALTWWPAALILSLAYATFIAKHYRGKISG